MKNLSTRSLLLFCAVFVFTLSSCDSDSLSDLDTDILGEWVVDNFLHTGEDLVDTGEIQDMHLIFSSNYDCELSWFEGADFFVIDGRWSSNETDATLELNLDNRAYFFCDDDDMIFNIFFFATDMEIDAECNGGDWMEIQLERL